MTAFFIPGVASEQRVLEEVYEEMRRQVGLDMGRRPNERRILSLWARRGSVDCVTEVGRPDPLLDGTVIAIFDMGSRQPFVLWWRQEDAAHTGVREILGCSAYDVSEFDG